MIKSYYLYFLYYRTNIRVIQINDSREKHINDFFSLSEDYLVKIEIFHFATYDNQLRKITTQFPKDVKLKKDIAIDKLYQPTKKRKKKLPKSRNLD